MGRRNYQGGTFTVEPNGERLKALRGSYPKQPRQYEVEKLAGVSRGQLTRYETGKPASAADLKKLADFYGVEPAELLSPEGLAMCNQILDEMCLFTNKKVVSNTNGNSHISVTTEVPVSNLKEEEFCSKCGHTGKLKAGICQQGVGAEGEPCGCTCDVVDNSGRVSERLSVPDEEQANLEHEDDKSTRPLESSTAQSNKEI